MQVAFIPVVVLALIFNVLSGFNDGGNLIATLLGSRVLPPSRVVPLILLTVLAGPFIFGTEVAKTIGNAIVNFQVVGTPVLVAALLAGSLTVLAAWFLHLPTSTSVALVGGMVGAAIMRDGVNAVHWAGVLKVIISLLGSVVIGFVVGFAVYRLMLYLLRRCSVSYQNGLRLGQVQYVTAALQGLGYGANDAEKVMGILAIVFMLGGVAPHFVVTPLIIVMSVGSFGLGLVLGGWRIAKTIGYKIFRLRPMHGVSVQLAAGTTVLVAAALGGPVSTTQTTDSALLGVGSADRPGLLRWKVVRDLSMAWAITLPFSFVLGMMVASLWPKP